ncbi:MAG: hypothetical protein ACTSQ8_07765 [Candidatus Helarchaeota archaeon]
MIFEDEMRKISHLDYSAIRSKKIIKEMDVFDNYDGVQIAKLVSYLIDVFVEKISDLERRIERLEE